MSGDVVRMKILLLGKDGQVGTELRRTIFSLGNLISVGRSDLNLENLPGLRHLLKSHQPDIIVNAAAYTAVDKAESDKESAFTINEKVVAVLADYAQNNKTLLVHYSTDYVFDGKKIGAYLETDSVNPQNIYGASKLAGEHAILRSGCDFLIFRTSWVFSASGKNFIKTILQLAKKKDSLHIVSDQYGAPTSAELIADVTAVAIAGYRKSYIHNGLYHLTATGTTSWYNLACYVVERVLANGINLKLSSKHIYPVTSEEYLLPAIRPKNSTLDISILSDVLSLDIVDWKTYVDRMIEQLIRSEFFDET